MNVYQVADYGEALAKDYMRRATYLGQNLGHAVLTRRSTGL